VCTYTCMHAYIHTFIHIHIHTYMHTCTHACIYLGFEYPQDSNILNIRRHTITRTTQTGQWRPVSTYGGDGSHGRGRGYGRGGSWRSQYGWDGYGRNARHGRNGRRGQNGRYVLCLLAIFLCVCVNVWGSIHVYGDVCIELSGPSFCHAHKHSNTNIQTQTYTTPID